LSDSGSLPESTSRDGQVVQHSYHSVLPSVRILIGIELRVEQAMISAVIGQLLVAACVVMTGLFGAKWHVGFPMWNRVVWGLRASYFPLANRIVLSFTWCASMSTRLDTQRLHTDSSAQAWFGGQVMKTLLGSMFPSIYRRSIGLVC
jgi:NCS1 family nucleobase:cation symporter-1